MAPNDQPNQPHVPERVVEREDLARRAAAAAHTESPEDRVIVEALDGGGYRVKSGPEFVTKEAVTDRATANRMVEAEPKRFRIVGPAPAPRVPEVSDAE